MNRWTVWATIAKLADIPTRGGLSVQGAAHLPIALFHVEGEVFAVEATCFRCGRDLALGSLDGYEVDCACGWCYDIVTGCTRGVRKLRLNTPPVRTFGGTVMVENAVSRLRPATVRREKTQVIAFASH